MNFDLERFASAHKEYYEKALAEITDGKKRSHWIWFIFPQLAGLGHSDMSQYYAISCAEEAEQFLADPYLGNNLRQICQALIDLECCDAKQVFGFPDYLKLRSSMTLFESVSNEWIFTAVLDKFFEGKKDTLTLAFLEEQ